MRAGVVALGEAAAGLVADQAVVVLDRRGQVEQALSSTWIRVASNRSSPRTTWLIALRGVVDDHGEVIGGAAMSRRASTTSPTAWTALRVEPVPPVGAAARSPRNEGESTAMRTARGHVEPQRVAAARPSAAAGGRCRGRCAVGPVGGIALLRRRQRLAMSRRLQVQG